MPKTSLSNEEKELIKHLLRLELDDLYRLFGYQHEYFKISYQMAKIVKKRKKSAMITRGMLSLIKLSEEDWEKEGRKLMKRLHRKICNWWLKNREKVKKIRSKFELACIIANIIKSFVSVDLSNPLTVSLAAVIVTKEGIDRLCEEKYKAYRDQARS